jgi:hypothetical protein
MENRYALLVPLLLLAPVAPALGQLGIPFGSPGVSIGQGG